MEKRESDILYFLKKNGASTSKEIHDNIGVVVSSSTLKRDIARIIDKKYIFSSGQGRATRYEIAPTYELLAPVNLEGYYEKEIDERVIKENFNLSLINDVLPKHCIFTEEELEKLNSLQVSFMSNVSQLSELEYKKEFERFAIDLSWKSSQIEGNTYSLLETERLLKEREVVAGKTKEEAVMLLNHKEALDFILDNPDYLYPLTVSKIEDIHSILIKGLAVDRNLRRRRVGISGTNYRPLDNEFQISEALKSSCDLINGKESVFEKALLALVLISYIQPFMDGNKRTARIVSNAILMNEKHCPLSFRTVNSIDYKKAMLLFYEQNNLSSFKDIFMDQFGFSVRTYF